METRCRIISCKSVEDDSKMGRMLQIEISGIEAHWISSNI
jgi:hypothetical protein